MISQYKQKIAETEMQALQAQMNPHFFFNSLNSIENFIMQNEKKLASDYLNKFARFIRSILDSSNNDLIELSKDLESLQLYIDLEQLRFNNKFTYFCQVDPSLVAGRLSCARPAGATFPGKCHQSWNRAERPDGPENMSESQAESII